MQDESKDQDHGQEPMNANHVDEIAQPEAIIHLGIDDKGSLTVSGLFANEFAPASNIAHAFMQMVRDEHDYLMSRVLGRYTDADRFRALRDFAVIGNTDPARFEVVNELLQKFEEKSGMDPAQGKRSEADFVKMANFLCHAMIETKPEVLTEADQERMKAAEEKRERRANKILFRDSRGNLLN